MMPGAARHRAAGAEARALDITPQTIERFAAFWRLKTAAIVNANHVGRGLSCPGEGRNGLTGR